MVILYVTYHGKTQGKSKRVGSLRKKMYYRCDWKRGSIAMGWPCVQKGQEVSIGLFKLKGDHFAHYSPLRITRYTGIPQVELNLCMT